MKFFKQGFKYGGAFVLLAGLIYLADPTKMWSSLSQLTWDWIAVLLIISIVLVWLSALKWKTLVTFFGGTVSVFELMRAYLMGYFINAFLPSSIGGDIARTYSIGKKVGQKEAFSATIVERYTGLVAMISLAFVVMWKEGVTSWTVRGLILLLVMVTIVGTIIALSHRSFALLQRFRVPEKWRKKFISLQQGVKIAFRNPRLLFKALSLSYVFHMGAVLNTWVTAQAIGWDAVQIGDLFCVVPLILVFGNMPITPSNLGVQEGAFYYFLHTVGATPAQALSIALILRAKGYVLGFFGGIVWLGRRRAEGLSVKGSTKPVS